VNNNNKIKRNHMRSSISNRSSSVVAATITTNPTEKMAKSSRGPQTALAQRAVLDYRREEKQLRAAFHSH
jgi:hypothetical protein